MMLKKNTGLAFAAICLTAIATIPVHAQMTGTSAIPGYSGGQGYQGGTSSSGSAVGNSAPQSDQGNMPSSSAGASAAGMAKSSKASQRNMSASQSARQNVIQSQHYDRALETNRGYRQARMRKECGPITDSELRQSCLASFNQDEPAKGSSHSHKSRRS